MDKGRLEHTDPENRGTCGFCGKEENGYAKQDTSGKWLAACWPCVKPTGPIPPQAKRKPVGTQQLEEEDEMARSDGRVKCTTKGCRNYVTSPVTECKTCREKSTAQEAPAPEAEPEAPAALSTTTTEQTFAGTPPPSVTTPVATVDITGSKPAFDPAKAVELYKTGMSVGQVADALGCFTPGNGRNRTRTALRAAGVYKERSKE